MEADTPATATLALNSDEASLKALPVSPLLRIPGELRNRIYSFVVDRKDIDLLSPGGDLSVCANPSNAALDVQAVTRNWSHLQRQYLGLTQVCRQVRSELLPICKSETTHCIRQCDVYEYIGTFVLPGGMKPKGAMGNLTILIQTQFGLMDILPLIKLCADANADRQNLFVTISEGGMLHDGGTLLHQYFNVKGNPKWKTFTENWVTRIMLGIITIEIWVKPAYYQAARKVHGEFSYEAATPDEARAERKLVPKNWWKSVGLDLPEDLRRQIHIRVE